MTNTYPRLRSHSRKRKSGKVTTYYFYDMRPEGKPDVPLGTDHAEVPKTLLRQVAEELTLLRHAIGGAYGYLWCVNNEPGTPHQYPPEKAAYEARKLLRDQLTTTERGHYINVVLPLVRSPGA